MVGGVLCFLFLQVIVPFRHLLIVGDAKWTEEGQDFSWRMMLRTKEASHFIFQIVDTDMLILDEKEHMQINWSYWPETRQRALFVPIESPQFNWGHHPGLTATYEPNVGLRAIYHLTSEDNVQEKRQQLARQWE